MMHTLERAGHITSFRSNDRAERPASLLSTPSKINARWRVLIVNAHASIRDMIRTVLETHSDLIEVVGEASDGRQAVGQAELYPIDLVLMDIHLSPMNSIDATRQLRQMLPQVVIVGIASEYSPLLYNAMIAEGAVAFVRTEDTDELLFRTIVFAMCAYHPTQVQSAPVHATAV
jgi:DNA-binding NarL/FixJ family response regulator